MKAIEKFKLVVIVATKPCGSIYGFRMVVLLWLENNDIQWL
jgi:hypothetical protein